MVKLKFKSITYFAVKGSLEFSRSKGIQQVKQPESTTVTHVFFKVNGDDPRRTAPVNPEQQNHVQRSQDPQIQPQQVRKNLL
jgi:hypothetical protein